MTDVQLYFSVGIPTIAVFVGMLVNGYWYQALHARMTALENRVTSVESRMSTMENRVYGQLEMLTGNIADMDNRLRVLAD